MYLVYNREFELVKEYKRLKDLQTELGEDFKESEVDTLEFIRGSTVIRKKSLEGLVKGIVKAEKEKVLDYLTSDLGEQEDETVELRTENKNLTDRLAIAVESLESLDSRVKELVETFEKDKSKEVVGEKEVEDSIEGILDSNDEDLDKYIEEPFGDEVPRVSRTEIKEEIREGKKVVSKVKEPVSYNFSFINVIEENKLPHINELRGKEIVRVEDLAQKLFLKDVEIQSLVWGTLEECGGYPKFQNRTVVSPEEAVWIIVSALKKNSNYKSIDQRFEKTKANAKQLYRAWDLQKSSIELMLK